MRPSNSGSHSFVTVSPGGIVNPLPDGIGPLTEAATFTTRREPASVGRFQDSSRDMADLLAESVDSPASRPGIPTGRRAGARESRSAQRESGRDGAGASPRLTGTMTVHPTPPSRPGLSDSVSDGRLRPAHTRNGLPKGRPNTATVARTSQFCQGLSRRCRRALRPAAAGGQSPHPRAYRALR